MNIMLINIFDLNLFVSHVYIFFGFYAEENCIQMENLWNTLKSDLLDTFLFICDKILLFKCITWFCVLFLSF